MKHGGKMLAGRSTRLAGWGSSKRTVLQALSACAAAHLSNQDTNHKQLTVHQLHRCGHAFASTIRIPECALSGMGDV